MSIDNPSNLPHNCWRDVLDALAELGRVVLAERADKQTRPEANVSQASASGRATSRPTHRARARRKVNTNG